MELIQGIQNALDYIEAHLAEEIDYDEVARRSCSSLSHFRRTFHILCGYTLAEYIRNRRLSLAATELTAGMGKVIDIATKYGYESPDSFAKAFRKFHGILPSEARECGSVLRAYSRLVLKFSLEGGRKMNYRIETKDEMTLLGYKRHFEGSPFGETRHKQEENFFITTRAHQWMLKGMANDKLSDYCVITNIGDGGYDFYISATTDKYELDNLYNSDVTGIDFMDKFGFEKIVIPERTYAVFETERQRYPISEYHEIRKQIAAEWLTNNEYKIIDAPELAVYHWGIVGGYPERTIEIWIPIEKK